MVSLPEFIVKAVEARNTSLGNNRIFGDNAVSYAASLLGERYKQVMKSVKVHFGYIPTEDEAASALSKLIAKTMELERQMRPQLEKMCEAIVTQKLAVPQETILLDCKLTDEIEPYNELRINPDLLGEWEGEGSPAMEIMKRRAIDSMVQGISYLMMTATYDSDKLNEWNPELPKLYAKIIALNDFLLFTKEEDITDKNPMLGAYVETDMGNSGEKTVINAQGLIYPFLLQETYRGFFELFASHGLPDTISDAMFIIRRADFTKAEAWDLRMGVPVWQSLDKLIPDSTEPSVYPYIFSSIASLDTDEFNMKMLNALDGGKETKEWLCEIINEAVHDREYQLFKNDIERFNMEKCLVNEG